MTYEELGQQVKLKYPQYQTYSDREIGLRVVEKYPVYQQRVTETGVPVATQPTAQPKFTPEAGEGILETTGKLLGNIPKSLVDFGIKYAKWINPLRSIPEAIKNISQIPEELGGYIREATQAGWGPGKGWSTLGAETAKTTAKGLIPTYVQKAFKGDFEGARQDLVSDPVGQTIPIVMSLKYAYDLAGKGAQFESAMEKLGSPIEKPLAPIVSKVVESIPKQLEKLNLRMTPTQKTAFKTRLDKITGYIVKNDITGTPSQRFKKVDNKYQETETTLQKFLNEKAKDRTINVQEMVDDLELLKQELMKDNVDAGLIDKQINSHITNIKNQYPSGQAPVARLNELKKSTFKEAYNVVGDKVLDSVEFAVGDIYRGQIAIATRGLTINGQSITQFNSEYSNLIGARNLLKTAEFRPQLGTSTRWTMRLLTGSAGYVKGGQMGAILAALLAEPALTFLFGTWGRSYLSRTIMGAKDIGKITPTIGAGAVLSQFEEK